MSKQDTTSHLCVAVWMSAVLSGPDKVPSLKEEQQFSLLPTVFGKLDTLRLAMGY